MRLNFIVNGDPTSVEADPGRPLLDAIKAALRQVGEARPSSDWEVRAGDGRLLDRGSVVADFGPMLEGWLFLTLRIGAGG